MTKMANAVKTVVEFHNLKKEDISIILELIATPVYELDSIIEHINYVIDFDKIMPEPKNESECPDEYKVNKSPDIKFKDDVFYFDWYKWRLDNWGTKWNAYDSYTNINDTSITFVFSTAWNLALPIIQDLSVMGYDIFVRYADEDLGTNCGKLKYSNEQGWRHIKSVGLLDPVGFAKDLWETY